jgi:hypothetical protein
MPKKITGKASSQPSAAEPAPPQDAGGDAVEKKASSNQTAANRQVWERIKKYESVSGAKKSVINQDAKLK